MSTVKKLLLVLLVLVITAVVVVVVLNGFEGYVESTCTVRINEVMLSNKGSVIAPDGGEYDWVELYNYGSAAVDISGFGLTDDILESGKYVLPQKTVLEAGEYVVVWLTGETANGLYAPFKVSPGETLALTDAAGNVFDSVGLTGVDSGRTLALLEGGAWGAALPSPGYPNTDEGAAAYASTLTAEEDTGIYINEFMASNASTILDENGVASDWIELYNSTAEAVDLSGWGISDDAARPRKYTLPDGVTIPAGGYLLIFCSGSETTDPAGELHAPFGLRAYEESVVLSTPEGRIADRVDYSRMESDVSMARTPDGTGDFALSTAPTPGYSNSSAGYSAFMASYIAPTGGVYISEMMGLNTATVAGPGGDYPDWVEIRNGGSAAVSLAGWGLSDNANNPAKWVFPDITLEPGEYLVVWATGNDVADAQKKNSLELNFSLSAAGDRVLLFAPDGSLADKMQAGAFLPDVSCGRDTAGALRYYETASPGTANGTGSGGITATPAFSAPPGIYGEAQTVAIAAGDGETIHYTVDCSTPTAASPVYSGPLTVSGNTVLRAVAIKDGSITGYTATATYLFTTDGADHAVQVVSLVADPDDLWNERTGIYVMGGDVDPGEEWPYPSANYYQKGEEWERMFSFELMGTDGAELFSQNVSGRIAGAYGSGREQKGFNLIARSEYGSATMAYAFFGEDGFAEYKAIVLRAGGQDQANGKIRDELSAAVLYDFEVNFLYQRYTPCVVYLNGEYWGIYFMKEKRNRFFVAQSEGLGLDNADDLTLMKSTTRVQAGSAAEWKELMSYVSSHSLADSASYAHVAEQVDIDSFIDYMCCEIYVANSDYWNIQYYKVPGGKWKWIYYDFCWGWYNVDHQTVTLRRQSDKPCSDLFNALLKNAEFKDKFCRRMAELMDTVFEKEAVLAKIDELYNTVQPEMQRERAKFNGADADAHNRSSYDAWLAQIERIRNFARNRRAVVTANMQSELGLSDSYMREVFGG